jgi:hypothetical protein
VVRSVVTGSPLVPGGAASGLGQRRELLGEAGEDLGAQLVVGEAAARLGLHHTGLAQDLHVVGQVGLLRAGLLDQVRRAEGLARQQGHDPEAERIAQHPDQIRID